MTYADIIAAFTPTTLAAIVADIEALGRGANQYAAKFGRDCERALIANVGEEEAQMMIEAEAH